MSSIFSKNEKKNKTIKTPKDRNESKIGIDSLTDENKEQSNDDEENNKEQQISLSFSDIINSIPKNATKCPNMTLQKDHTEWRWRFFEIKERKMVEISRKDPNKERIYMDNTGKWTNYSLEGNWDKFLIDARYSYGRSS